MNRSWQLRAGPGALIVLAHLVFFAVLIRYAGAPSTRDEQGAARYVSFVLLPEKAGPAPAEVVAVRPPLPRKRMAAVQREEAAPAQAVQAPATQDAAPEPEASEVVVSQGNRLDMEALRSAARQADRERVPTALERLREAEQMRSQDDSPLVRGIQRAKRPNCQTAYSGGDKLNLIMLIPLVVDTVTDKGCKW